MKAVSVFLLVLLVLTPTRPVTANILEEFSTGFTRYQAPEFLTFDELVTVSGNPNPKGALGRKIEKLWRTPIISNEAYFRGVRAKETADFHARPEDGEILHYRSGAPGLVLSMSARQHRHRRFRRDARDISPHILIEHQIPDDQHTGRPEFGEWWQVDHGCVSIRASLPTLRAG